MMLNKLMLHMMLLLNQRRKPSAEAGAVCLLRADCAGEGCSCGHGKNAIHMLLLQKRRLTDEVLLLLKRAGAVACR